MDDDWDDTTPVAAPPMSSGVACEGGRKFSAGRGFKAVAVDDDTWGNGNSTPKNDFADSGWNDAPSDSYNNNRDHRGGGRGRGGRGGGRGGGFRGDRNRNQDDDSWGGGGGGRDESNGDEGYGGGRSGGYDGERRGRGGGRRGGRGGFGGDDEDGGRRGGRGGSRGGFRGGDRNGDGDGHEENGEEKKREIYVPVERTNDEELFTSTITSGINFVKLDDIEVNVSGEDAPPPINTFDGSGLRPYLLTNVKKSGYNKPTPIQKYAIPIIMKGRDLMACAQTGSGKTAAFLLPMINTLLANQEPPVVEGNCAQPRVVIVSPTRELAIQIFEQAKKFAYDSIVKTVVAYGGTSVNHQRDKVISGCHILVATPGRLNDFVKRGHVSFGSVQYFVLDEADRMLDLGFLPCVEQMLGDASMTATGERQTLMFSATFPEEVQHLAGKFLHNYLFVTVGIVGSASTDVQQIFIQISKFDKRNKLLNILNECKEKTVVFVETKRNADFLATFLSENDIPTTSIHGDRLQREREQALWDFKKGIRNILVATGVAARGLDIQGIEHVINYDLPKSIDEYVHRIGRTGRVGNRGKATSFFDSSHDSNLAGSLAKILKQAGQEVPDWLSSGGFDGGARDAFGGRDIRGDDYGRAQDFIAQPAEENDEAW